MENIKKLQSEGKKILIDFFGDWCGPCKVLIPKLEKMETTYDDIIFLKVNVDNNMDYAMSLGIRSVPTVIVYDGETLVLKSTGVQTDDFYKSILDTL
jgi:thioredoxin